MAQKLVFAGSSLGEPWWVIGRITARLLADKGYDVEVATASASTENPRWVGGGKAQLGACVPKTIRWAINGEHLYEGEEFCELRAVAKIRRPSWLGVACRAELGFTDLRKAAGSGYPLRIMTNKLDSIASVVPRRALEHYGLSEDAVRARGGDFREMTGIYQPYVREGSVDLIVAGLYLGNTAISRYWNEAAVLLNLRFLDLEDALVDKLVQDGYGTPGNIPFNLLRGVTHEVRTIAREDGIVVYLPADTDESFTYELARLYDQNREMFFMSAVHMALDPQAVTGTAPLPLHPGAMRYYKEAGYL